MPTFDRAVRGDFAHPATLPTFPSPAVNLYLPRLGTLHMPRAIVIILLLVLMPVHARAEAKIALLIGNETYASQIGPLANPHNDVALLDATLKGLGFEVTVVRDAGLGALTRAVNAYARRLQEAGPDP